MKLVFKIQKSHRACKTIQLWSKNRWINRKQINLNVTERSSIWPKACKPICQPVFVLKPGLRHRELPNRSGTLEFVKDFNSDKSNRDECRAIDSLTFIQLDDNRKRITLTGRSELGQNGTAQSEKHLLECQSVKVVLEAWILALKIHKVTTYPVYGRNAQIGCTAYCNVGL